MANNNILAVTKMQVEKIVQTVRDQTAVAQQKIDFYFVMVAWFWLWYVDIHVYCFV